ncbi:MAG: hypothetical protein KGM42_02145 [Hyphomicrobiales bacterium]|nr:hypothetical protein [Hyphomicrobiales bacterium]
MVARVRSAVATGRALTRPTVDLTIQTHPGLVTRIVERPGATLDDAGLADLVARLRTVASAALARGQLNYGVFSGDRDRLSSVVVTLMSDARTGRPIAFNALALLDVELDGEPVTVTHLGLVMVDKEERRRGLSSALYGLTTLLLFVRGALRPCWISNVTQVPAVAGMVCETFSDVYPSPLSGARQSFAHLTLARRIMRAHRDAFGVSASSPYDEKRSVIIDSYTGGSDDLKKAFDQAQPHRNPLYADFCARELDYERGDDFLQIGRMDLAAARRYLAANIPPRSLPALAAAALFLAIQRVVLPVVYWFDDAHRFGALRPWRRAST